MLYLDQPSGPFILFFKPVIGLESVDVDIDHAISRLRSLISINQGRKEIETNSSEDRGGSTTQVSCLMLVLPAKLRASSVQLTMGSEGKKRRGSVRSVSPSHLRPCLGKGHS